MDRNQATGLILIALMVITYFTFFAPEPTTKPEIVEQETTQASPPKNQVMPDTVTTKLDVADSVLNALNTEKYGVFSIGASGQESIKTIENADLRLEISTKGAHIREVELKNFKTFFNEPLILLTEKSNHFDLKLNTPGKVISLSELHYSYESQTASDSTIHKFELDLGQGKSVKHIYTVPASGYEVDYKLELNGLNGLVTEEDLVLNWEDHIIPQEKDIELSRTNTTINYFTAAGDFDYLSERSTGLEEETIDERVNWVSIKQRFFIAGIIAKNSFSKATVSTNFNSQDESEVKFAQLTLDIPYQDIATGKGEFTYYFGPNDYHITRHVAEDFSKNLWLGWPPMLWVNKFIIIPLFDVLNNFLSNYGIIIIIMVLIIKLALSPLSYKSYVSMAKMKVLKPELDIIKEKHGDDMQKAQQEQMKLYSKVGVNPISGCIPMVLQMPILLSMFYFFPQSIELRGKSFLWAENLSTFDSILDLPFEIPFYGSHVSLFVLLMTVSTIFITWQNQQVSTVQGPMKSFSYMMPVIFMFVLNSYPAALSFYYFVSNLVTFGQQALIRKMIDEDKLKAILEENKKRRANKKKSKFQLKLEEAMKASQQGKAKSKK
ncbi:MAG: membrane protein insertase YidC [Bacteroidota bacterium]